MNTSRKISAVSSVEQPAKPSAKLLQMVSPKPPLPLPLADSKDYARAWRLNLTYLRAVLPQGSQSLYSPRKYGNHMGIPIRCPHCDEKPPQHVKQHARWRWMSFHISTRHQH